jgi:enoyl-[acyl-carrier protein] reductase/trans-2-enoyl-CoA reductase (NAD+)
MIVKPKVRNFICLTAHPVGCAESVRRQIDYVRAQPPVRGAKRVLVIGSSTGYGLASRISAAFGMGADTVGVMFEKPASGKRTASPGFYNNRAFKAAAKAAGRVAETVNGDAFSDKIKAETIALIKEKLGTVDLVIYSLAAPRRTDREGVTWSSVIKPTRHSYKGKTLNLSDNTVGYAELEPATDEETEATIKVMGGEDWQEWIRQLDAAGVLAPRAVTLAYSYIGPSITYPIYKDGTIGRAKEDLYRTAERIREAYSEQGYRAYVSVNKAVVTQSSAAIPSVSLYLSALYKVMKQDGSHEGCIEQMYRLFAEKVYGEPVEVDERGLIRMDDWEMRPEIQEQVMALWERVDSQTVDALTDIEGYWADFYNLFGFGYAEIDYDRDVDIF